MENRFIIIVAGSRHITNKEVVISAIESSPWFGNIKKIITGGCRGVDSIAEEWANNNGIEVKSYPVSQKDWNTYGLSAGPRRNKIMAESDAQCLIAIPHPFLDSKGTKSIISMMRALSKEVFEYKRIHSNYGNA